MTGRIEDMEDAFAAALVVFAPEAMALPPVPDKVKEEERKPLPNGQGIFGKPEKGKGIESKPGKGKGVESKSVKGKGVQGQLGQGKPDKGKGVESKSSEEKPVEGQSDQEIQDRYNKFQIKSDIVYNDFRVILEQTNPSAPTPAPLFLAKIDIPISVYDRNAPDYDKKKLPPAGTIYNQLLVDALYQLQLDGDVKDAMMPAHWSQPRLFVRLETDSAGVLSKDVAIKGTERDKQLETMLRLILERREKGMRDVLVIKFRKLD